MKKFATLTIVISGFILGAVLIIAMIGASLPENYSVTKSIELKAPRIQVWGFISNFAATKDWNPDIIDVQRDNDIRDREVWIETYGSGDSIRYEITEKNPPISFKRQTLDDNLPFVATWHIELWEEGSNTVLKITEEGKVPNPFVRFIASKIMGHDIFLRSYLHSLKNYFESKDN